VTEHAAAVEVVLLTQDHCGLCEHAKAVLDRLAADYPLRVTTLDLASREGRALAARGGLCSRRACS
jgi:thiol-disulfide isomerase/thioredoxin